MDGNSDRVVTYRQPDIIDPNPGDPYTAPPQGSTPLVSENPNDFTDAAIHLENLTTTVDELQTVVLDILDRLRTHGLIGPL